MVKYHCALFLGDLFDLHYEAPCMENVGTIWKVSIVWNVGYKNYNMISHVKI